MHYHGPGAPRPTNGLAIASLVLGILSLCGIGSILAVIFGHVSLNQIRRSGDREGGRGMAITGVVLGWIGIAAIVVYLVFYAALLASLSSSS